MRRAAKVDNNQAQVVAELRQVPGISVLHLHRVGQGCPDLLIGYRERNFLVELKTSVKDHLTADEIRFRGEWTGQSVVATTADDILRAIGIEWRTGA